MPVSSQPMAISRSHSPRQGAQHIPSPEPLDGLSALRSVSRFMSPADEEMGIPPSSSQLISQRSSRLPSPRSSQTNLRDRASPYPRPASPPVNAASTSTHGKPIRRRKRRESKGVKSQLSNPFISEFPVGPVLPASRSQKSLHVSREARSRVPSVPVPHRSTVERGFTFLSGLSPRYTDAYYRGLPCRDE